MIPLTGVVKEFHFTNPHGIIKIVVPAPAGTTILMIPCGLVKWNSFTTPVSGITSWSELKKTAKE